MSNETQWDVFEDALRALEEFGEQGSSWEMAYDDLSARYSAASDESLPDDLPVIPKAWGDTIEEFKANHYRLSEIFTEWDWNYDEQELVARAWVLGVWRVEETGEIMKLEAD